MIYQKPEAAKKDSQIFLVVLLTGMFLLAGFFIVINLLVGYSRQEARCSQNGDVAPCLYMNSEDGQITVQEMSALVGSFPLWTYESSGQVSGIQGLRFHYWKTSDPGYLIQGMYHNDRFLESRKISRQDAIGEPSSLTDRNLSAEELRQFFPGR